MHATHLRRRRIGIPTFAAVGGERPRGPAARLALATVLAAAPLAGSAATISLPYSFSNGTVADATEVNANFGALVSESNAQDARLGAVEADASAHAADPAAHHTKTADASELTTGTLSDARLSALVSLLGPTIDLGELGFDPATQSELDAHAGNASAHHVRYGDAEATAAVAAADSYVLNTGDTVGGPLLVTTGSGVALQSLAGSSGAGTDTHGISATALGTATKYGGSFYAGAPTIGGSAYAVYGEARGTSAKTGGYFKAGESSGSGDAVGVYGEGQSAAFEKWGGSFLAGAAGTSGIAYGVEGVALGSATKYGGSFTAGSSSSPETGTAYGVTGNAYGSFDSLFGGKFTAGNASSPTFASAFGVYGEAHGTLAQTGGYFKAGLPAQAEDAVGVHGEASGVGAKWGGSFLGGDTATSGQAYGVEATALSSSTKYGGAFTAGDSASPNSGTAYGIDARAYGTGNKRGGVFNAGTTTQSGTAIGVEAFAYSSSHSHWGGYFYAENSGTGNSIGVEADGGTYDFYASGPGANYGSASSARWKRDVRPIDEPLALVERLRGVTFTWDAAHGGERDVGMIAEEVGEVLPEIVQYEANGVDATGMDYSKLTPLLVEAVKALAAQNRELEQQLATLRERFAALEQAATGRRSAGFASSGGG